MVYVLGVTSLSHSPHYFRQDFCVRELHAVVETLGGGVTAPPDGDELPQERSSVFMAGFYALLDLAPHVVDSLLFQQNSRRAGKARQQLVAGRTWLTCKSKIWLVLPAPLNRCRARGTPLFFRTWESSAGYQTADAVHTSTRSWSLRVPDLVARAQGNNVGIIFHPSLRAAKPRKPRPSIYLRKNAKKIASGEERP